MMPSTEIVGAMPAPDGVVPDFSLTRTSVQQKFILTYATTLGIAIVLVLLRLYTRLYLLKSFGLDDWAVIASTLFSIAFFVLCFVAMDYGFGRHLYNVPVTALPTYLKLLIPIVVTYCWAPFMTKFSILILYHRLNPSQKFRYIIYFLIFVITGYTLATTLATAGGCNPLNTGKTPCINSLALWQAILNIVTDFLMLLMPIPLLWALQLPLLQKLSLGLIFAIGSAATITSIVRITYIMNILDKQDFTWYEATVCVWSAIELNFGIMCNCLAVLKPFVRLVFPMLVPSSYGGNRYPSGRSGRSNTSRHRKQSGSHPLESFDNGDGGGRRNNQLGKSGGVHGITVTHPLLNPINYPSSPNHPR
ncbi:hypothetical protein ASPSYDRAFT_134418 [Aspergillus sydowii CBS 593.65]|uniref:Rhodopsin domain-containing protein n=1 Tax=Aspergillus sydowii CBS 593.65 TaxID=1036612 RepID=A0A1L9TAT6_9EURO|nr:uncharacterized protein ASPSYDRAFT_134418 [Aspergillus sydowii CBS 593.65]OJJ56532.1 hypothetical protein ASPSYDRAFT_134418 [Aspergillus sydowii CBS 593.65]